MENNWIQPTTGVAVAAPRTFLTRVFAYMALAMVLSGGMAWLFAHNRSLLSLLINFETGKQTLLGWVVLLAPIGLVLLLSARVERMSMSAAVLTFIAYSAITGISLCYVFLAYTATSIATTFFMAAAVFGIMAVAGYTTKVDLTRFGSIMMIGLIGVLLASLVNLFMGSDTLGYIISIVGVLVFTGLTAYDMQKLKNMAMEVPEGTELAQKMSLMGALRLYLDFINLFLLLLRLFGSRRN